MCSFKPDNLPYASHVPVSSLLGIVSEQLAKPNGPTDWSMINTTSFPCTYTFLHSSTQLKTHPHRFHSLFDKAKASFENVFNFYTFTSAD
mmetsp:Transcript_7174/g.26896  ORF Transcript_7174/g.26896 Transcript_7174/m.26896 type:complete len:90 (+) Transcript_7174:3196-3465(+)